MVTLREHTIQANPMMAWIATISVAIVALASGCAATEPERDASGEIVADSKHADVFSIGIGDCTLDGSADAVEVSTVHAVPCDQEHDNEVYASILVDDGDYPGDDTIEQIADESCYQKFEEFIGVSWDESLYDYSWMTPTTSSWGIGDREVLCFVYAGDLSPVTGSLRGVAN